MGDLRYTSASVGCFVPKTKGVCNHFPRFNPKVTAKLLQASQLRNIRWKNFNLLSFILNDMNILKRLS